MQIALSRDTLSNVDRVGHEQTSTFRPRPFTAKRGPSKQTAATHNKIPLARAPDAHVHTRGDPLNSFSIDSAAVVPTPPRSKTAVSHNETGWIGRRFRTQWCQPAAEEENKARGNGVPSAYSGDTANITGVGVESHLRPALLGAAPLSRVVTLAAPRARAPRPRRSGGARAGPSRRAWAICTRAVYGVRLASLPRHVCPAGGGGPVGSGALALPCRHKSMLRTATSP